MLIVARGCVQQYSRRFTHFAASAVPKAVVRAIKSHSARASCSDRRSHTQTSAPSAVAHAASPALDLLAKPRATGRCQARDAVLTERGQRCVHPAPILQHSGAVMRLGRPCVVGAVQVAPTPRIRSREAPRHGESEAHGASKSRPSNLKLALVVYWYALALCTESSRHIRHIADGNCDLSEVASNGVRLQPVAIIWVYPASPLTTGRRDVRGRPR
jgi:hypothetical protein